MLWYCLRCTCAYSVGAPRCPECGSTNYSEDPVPKITVHGGSEPPVTDEEKAAQAEASTDGALVDAPEPVDVKPAVNDPKHAWIDYAVAQGWTRENAEAATKADLVAAFNKE